MNTRPILTRLRKDNSGGILIMFAFSLFLLLLSIGGTIEFGQAILVKNNLGHAIDSAALAAATTTNTADRNPIAKRYFEANYNKTAGVTVNYESLNVQGMNGSEITISANANVNTTLLSVNGRDVIPVSDKTVVQAAQRGRVSDVDMVVSFDASTSMLEMIGSMSKLDSGYAALDAMVSALQLKSPATNPNVRFGLNFWGESAVKRPLNAGLTSANNSINSIYVTGRTCGACGLQAAVQQLSSAPIPTSLRNDGLLYSPNRIVVFMTDGILNTLLDGTFYDDELLPIEALKPARDEAPAQCDILKSMGVTIYTIGFSAITQVDANKQALADCASDDGNGAKLTYYAPTGEELISLFGVIGTNSTKIRIME